MNYLSFVIIRYQKNIFKFLVNAQLTLYLKMKTWNSVKFFFKTLEITFMNIYSIKTSSLL